MTPVLTPARPSGSEQRQFDPSSPTLDQSRPTTSTLSNQACLLLALILPAFAIAPLFYPGYFQHHEGLVPLWNIADLKATLGDLTWLPHVATRFDPLRGTGLLPYYLAGLLPLAPATAFKVVVGGGWLLGSLGLFLWLRGWWGSAGALIAALIYTYLPYQLVTVYVRGAWGETLVWGLLPWAILVTVIAPASWGKKGIPLIVLCWLALGLSQLGLSLGLWVFVLLLMGVIQPAWALWRGLAAGVGLLGAIPIYLFLPSHTLFITSQTIFVEHMLYPFQLFSARWGFGPSRPGWDDGLSLQIGLAALGLALLAVFLWQGRQAEISRTDPRLLFFGGAVVVVSLLQFPITIAGWNLPLWPGHPLSALLSYPWQLLGLAGLGCAVLAGTALRLDRSDQLNRLPLLASLIIFIILSVYPYLLPQFIQLDHLPLDRPEAELGESHLALLSHDFAVEAPAHTAGLDQGEVRIPLAVYGPLQAGDRVLVEVIWQPLQPFAQDLKVFVHLVDAQDQVLAQFDGPPQAGSYPTSHWSPGEIIEDAYPIDFPAGAPPGPYRVYLGLYDEATLARLPVPGDAAGRVIFEVE